MSDDRNTPRPNRAEEAVTLLSSHLKSFRRDMTVLRKSHPRLEAGISALIEVHDQMGDAGLTEFTRWMVHPTSGFLAQHQSVNPVAPMLRDVLDDAVSKENHRCFVAYEKLQAERRQAKLQPAKEQTDSEVEVMSSDDAYDNAIMRITGLGSFFKNKFTRIDPSATKFDIDRLTDHAAKAMETYLNQKAQGKLGPQA